MFIVVVTDRYGGGGGREHKCIIIDEHELVGYIALKCKSKENMSCEYKYRKIQHLLT